MEKKQIRKIGVHFLLGSAIFSLGLFFLFSLSLKAEEPAKSPAKFVMKLGTIAPENSSWGDSAKATSRDIEEKTHGQVKITWYFGAVMGDEPDMIRKIRLGQLQGAVFTLMGAGKIAPEMKVFALPFLFNGYDEADYVLTKMAVTIDKIFLEKGFINLGLVDIGFARTFSKIPMRGEADLDKIKAWSWAGEPMVDEAYRMIGVKTFTPLPMTEVLTSLQTGLVNSVFGTCYSTLGLQWHTQVKYMTEYKTAFSPGAILVDKKVFDTLPPEYQKIVKETCQKFIPELRNMIRQDEEKACAGLKKYGIVGYDVDPEYFKKIRANALTLYDKFADQYYPRWLLAGVLNILQQYRVEKGTNK
ncbi:MAG: TRAP transporter substrate-binding protein DctP [bacterium]|nr:TRAP transporter substrate-binding protein DctP [bacterium]